MAKDGAVSGAQADEIEAILQEGKKKELNFILMKAKGGVVMKCGPSVKGFPKLRAEAKEAGGMPALSVCGRLTVSGRTMNMTAVEDDPPEPSVMRKLAAQSKKHFKALGIRPAKMVMTLPNGEVIDSDSVEDAEEDDEGSADQPGADAAPDDGDAAQPSTGDALRAELTERLKALVPAVKQLAAAGAPTADRLGAALKAAAQELAAQTLERAQKLIEAVEAGLRSQGVAVPSSPPSAASAGADPAPAGEAVDQAAFRAQIVNEFKELSGDLRTLMQAGGKAVVGKTTQLVGMFKTEIDNDLKRAGQILGLLRSIVAAELPKLAGSSGGGQDGAAQAEGSGEAKGATDGLSQGEEQGVTEAEGDENIFKKLKEKLKKAVGGSEAEEATGTPEEAPVKSLLEQIMSTVNTAIGAAADFVKDNAKLIAIAADYPEAAIAAKTALDSFDATLGGDVEITPEVLEKASTDAASARKLVDDARSALKSANDMKKGGSRNKAIKKAQKDLDDALAARANAEAYEKAAKGKKLLTDAITTGPFSPGSPKSFTGGAALEFVKGATRDPDLAGTALEQARRGEHGEVLFQNLGKMIDRKEAGFPKPDGARMDARSATIYADRLMTMGGSVGSEYFDRMDAYLATGRHWNPSPSGEVNGDSDAVVDQKRSMMVGKAMVGTDGSLDFESDAAKNAIGDALFNFQVLGRPTPANAAAMLKTVNHLKDPVNKAKAEEILKGVPEPSDPGAMTLVRNANAKGPTDPVGKGDVRNAVMASMMKSLDQGPVGSCFSTAPARRLRETKPLEAMQAYATIAGTGKYKPPFGPEVPVITNTPPGEDPVMRSWEYSLATSTARLASSDRSTKEAARAGKGLATLDDALKAKALLGSDKLDPEAKKKKEKEESAKAKLRLAKLKADVAANFTFIYDPLDKIKDSSDGSSTQGRYILKCLNPAKEIRKKEDYVAAITATALASLGMADDAPDAQMVKDHVASDAFINAVTGTDPDAKKNYFPWAMTSGGATEEATQTLFGSTLTQKEMAPEVPEPPPPRPDEGKRTEQVLLGFLKGMSGATGDMVTIRTVGMHGFNALPNNPSLDALKGDTDEKRAKNVKDKLIDPGKDLAKTKLPLAKAQQLFDAQVNSWSGGKSDPAVVDAFEKGVKAHRPTADMTPAEVEKAIKDALNAVNDIRAKKDAEDWKAKKGGTVTDDEFKNRVKKEKADWESAISDSAKTRMIQDLGPPEFLLADTNWGSGKDHTFFVIVPDPTTGDPVLWKKTVPPGKYSKCDREWIDKEWSKID